MLVREIGEFGLIRRLTDLILRPDPRVIVGIGDDAAVVLAGAASLVPVHVGRGHSVGPGDQGRGPGLLPLAAARRQARAADRGRGGAGGAAIAGEARAVNGCALRDGLP